MKKLTSLAVVLMLACMASMAFAQAETGDVGVFADTAATQSTLAVTAFVPTFFYVVAFDLAEIKGWELSIAIDPSFTVLGRTLDQPSSLNVGNLDNFIVGSGGCFNGQPTYTLVTYNIGFFTAVVPNDSPVCIGPASPSSFDPALPAAY